MLEMIRFTPEASPNPFAEVFRKSMSMTIDDYASHQ